MSSLKPTEGGGSLSRSDLRQHSSSVPADWAVVALPTALALRTVSAQVSLAVVGLLVVVVFMRRRKQTYSMKGGPFVALVIAAGVVLTRPEPSTNFLFFAILTMLIFRLVITVHARVIFASVIDGAGLYLVLNVLGYWAGFKSAGAADRIGGFIESSGLVRAIFPLARSLDIAPSIASLYIAAAAFLIFERGWTRRLLRLVCFAAAFIVVSEAGARTALFTAIALPIVILLIPLVTRWLAQILALFAAVSSLLLTDIISSTQAIITPVLTALSPGRDTRIGDITSLNNRDIIWARSLDYWSTSIDRTIDELFGFGQNGQYTSGVSMTYAESLSGTVRNSQYASLHNSFLQQLFDGGIFGWALLTLAIFWAGIRMARHRGEWSTQGVAATAAISALLVNGLTQATIAPGFAQESFWVLMVLVGAASQAKTSLARDNDEASRAESADSSVP